MVSKTIEVTNPQGLHMRPAGLFVAEMKKFADCEVTLKSNGKTAKATSVMQIMSAGFTQGTQVEITANGKDEEKALDTAIEMFKNNFGE